MFNSMLFLIMEEACTAVLILGEDVEREQFLASRLTRSEVQRHLLIIANASEDVPAATRQLLPELEWDGWDKVRRELRKAQPDSDDLLWFALRSLTPATLMWLQVYRKNAPELFAFTVTDFPNVD